MVYTPTTWINDTSPAINATNLNKMETGIDEAHDHIADVANPHSVTKAQVGLTNVEDIAHSTDAHTMAIDGRDVSVDGSKLDGIATGADVTADNTCDSPNSIEYMVPIWAEENAALGNGAYEWAYGNGANTPNDGGLTVYIPSGYSCSVVAMSLRLGSGTATVELVYNGSLQGANCNVAVASGQGATNDSFTPISLSDGDYINFRTTAASGTSAPNVVTAWLKYTG